ncbi:MAG: sigma-70 family RNA polymerase sigma factor [Endomicrobium sp.]|jgi:RNA polymerase sigma-70 factor (ECF subfamily)|nr:sigma-70 family RNA polymerase sigma factor [Endomicrobium sp.]
MKYLSDSELVAFFKQGKDEAFEEIVMRYQTTLYTYILSIIKNAEVSNDILQDVFIRVFKKLNKYSEENKLKNWLFTLTRNITMDYFRKNSTKLVPLEAKGDKEFSIIDTLSANDSHPLDIAIRNDNACKVNRALSKLNADERELIALKDSMTFQEIAQMQNRPIGTLLSKFNRALKKLKTILMQCESEVCNEYM